MICRFSGSVNPLKFEHPAKALELIDVIVSGMVTVRIWVMPSKALSPIATTVCPSIFSGIDSTETLPWKPVMTALLSSSKS